MAFIYYNGSRLNTLCINEIGPVVTADTEFIDKTTNEYIKKYYYRVVCSGEINTSLYYDTLDEATADRNNLLLLV